MPTIANAIETVISKSSDKEKKEKVDKEVKEKVDKEVKEKLDKDKKADKEKSEKNEKTKDEKIKKDDDEKKTKTEKIVDGSAEAINEIKNIFMDAVNDYAPSPLNVPSPTPPMP